MLITNSEDAKYVDLKDGNLSFLDEFEKRFTNFCKKAPLRMTFTCTVNKVDIYMLNNSNAIIDSYSFNFDKKSTVKVNINRIKEYLLDNWYPQMEQVLIKYEDPSAEEIQAMIDSGFPEEKAIMHKKSREEVIRYVITKMIIDGDKFIIRKTNKSSDKEYLYKCKAPITIIYRKLTECLDDRDRWLLFYEKTFFEKEVVLSETPWQRPAYPKRHMMQE